ncbi:heavy metal translocating P-type ATPase [Flexivirga meconopsidis]|uniref:heavy metal translocating P-type ATPase n=1 Tax=Flexivirga meconopsidis TaxID=2977121 RepID=UPI00223F96AF|nr:heavy metal translocating P-type ATPase [Flexivirga meconopsidis]
MTAVETARDAHTAQLQLDIGGMTCAACANRVERKLGKLDGVRATVNLATDRATITGLGPEQAEIAIAAVESAGYTAALHDPEDDTWSERAAAVRLSSLRRRLAVAALLAVPLCDLTILLALVPSWRFAGWQTVCVLLAVPIVTWCAWPFHKATLRGLRHGALSMDTLVSLGATVSFGWALYVLLIAPADAPGYWLGFGTTPAGADAIYLDVAAGMVTFQLGGRYFETRARGRAGDVLQALAGLAVKQVRRLCADGTVETIPTEDLRVGDRYAVIPGERLVADGVIADGLSTVDTSAMTGESMPLEVGPGDAVLGGTSNLTGRLVVRAEAVGERTRLAQMAAIADEAQRRKSRAQKVADKVTGYFVPAVIAIAGAVGVAWWALGATVDQALANGVAVLIIACPCALGLATPTALMVGVGRGGQLGILIKGHDALEMSGKIDTVVFDKTGTLTTGTMAVRQITPLGEQSADAVLRVVADLESASEHPVARAIVRHAEQTVGAVRQPASFSALPGSGAEGVVDGRRVLVGRPGLFPERGLPIPYAGVEAIARAESDGAATVVVALDDEVVATISIADSVKRSAAPAVAALRALGLRTVLLTGDSAGAARSVARSLGVDDVRAGVLPDQKAATISQLRAGGHCVAMVGDGINDSAALATADLGIALVRGTDIAMKAADVIVVRHDLRAVVDAVRLSRRTMGTIRGNLVWAFGYNVAAIPIAAAGLLNPLIAAAAMAMSSVLVISNSLRLKNFEPLR